MKGGGRNKRRGGPVTNNLNLNWPIYFIISYTYATKLRGLVKLYIL